jgi:HEAT repeat protein
MYRTAFLAAALIGGAELSATAAEPEPPIMLAQAEAEAEVDADKDAVADTDQGKPQRAPTEEESLALAALEGLMAQPSERALPILKKVLGGSQSVLVKRRALFVLSQISAPEAQTLLIDTARSGDAALRAEAIRSIGISGNPKSLPVLQQLYERGDAQTKRQVLEAWLISRSKKEVYQAALNAKTDAESNDAIRILSAMGARDELRKLGETRKPNRNLVKAYAIAGDLASLRKIVDGNGEVSTRREAVRSIGIIQSDAARVALREIYSSAKDPELRDAALQGMLISSDEQGMLALYRASKNAEEKRALLRTLSVINGDAALQAIDAALEGKK